MRNTRFSLGINIISEGFVFCICFYMKLERKRKARLHSVLAHYEFEKILAVIDREESIFFSIHKINNNYYF